MIMCVPQCENFSQNEKHSIGEAKHRRASDILKIIKDNFNKKNLAQNRFRSLYKTQTPVSHDTCS